MKGRPWLLFGGGLALCAVALSACKRNGGATSASDVSCATSADCSQGQVCGFANLGGDRSCAARGACVTPIDPQPTMLCGCDGGAIELVVDDVEAGVYYWSGVVQGQKGFPPCGDAAIAPSADDASQDALSEPSDAAAGDG
jgi:hypothetical protein